jgi:phosphoribosylformylglycinamidine cyclo-ligase
MYQVFNMGHRMELYVAPAIIQVAESSGVAAQVIGRVEAAPAPR